MAVTWGASIDGFDWGELEALYRAAPLGNKSASDLQTVFTNSRYRVFAFEEGRLVGAGRALADGADCSYICDIAVLPSHQGSGLGKEPFYRKFGFRRMLTAMAIFDNPAQAAERGYVSDD